MALDLQHVNVKIFTAGPADFDPDAAIPVFHRWIQNGLAEELLIDVADYRHVPAGPGILLVGHEANYSLDYRGGRLGLLYNRKAAVEGSTQDKLLQAFFAALEACRLLEEDAALGGALRFDGGQCEVMVNDRLLAPNRDETWHELEPELERFFDGLLGRGGYTLARAGEPRERFRVEVRAAAFRPVAELLERVAVE